MPKATKVTPLPVPSAALVKARGIVRQAIIEHAAGGDLDMVVWYAADMIVSGKSASWPAPTICPIAAQARDAT